MDARRSNRLFRKPPRTRLGSVEALSRLSIEVEGKKTIWTAQEDVRDYFYRLYIGRGLGEWFSLPPIKCALMRKILGSEAPGALGEGDFAYPFLLVLPMGFSWAFYLAQEAHDALHRKILGSSVPFIIDREPPTHL